MIKPNYESGSIVNLMSSIKNALGGKSVYPLLGGFDFCGVDNKNIVLIVIDGMGYEYLKKYGKESFIYENLKGKITSVFPATTASAMTTFQTGVAPQQHALTGWFMYLKEIDGVSIILPFTSRGDNLKLSVRGIKYEDIYNERNFFEDLEVNSYSIKHKNYANSEYSLAVSKGAKKLSFTSLNGLFKQINNALSTDEDRKFILAYWDGFDSLCHKEGAGSDVVKKHFVEIDKKLKSFAKTLKNKNTAVIVTADHGVVDTKSRDRVIQLKDHPEFVDTLTMPLSGEPRAVYCYVKPNKIKKFENYVKTKFKKVCEMHKSNDLIGANYFGLYDQNKKLKERVGDYILIMKENYIMKDLVSGERENICIGNHGGTSKEEMFVPLIIVE